MNKRAVWIWFKYLGLKVPKNTRSISLVELIISIMVIGIMFLSFYSLENFSHKQVMSADRRAKVQSGLAYCLEHMSKYVQQANGNTDNPAIKLYPAVTSTGFQVRFDCKTIQTPSDLSDDVWVYYTLSGTTLSAGCSGANCATCERLVPVPTEVLSSNVVANFNNSVPAVFPGSPTDGFYVAVDPLGNFADIGLVGRYYPAQEPTLETRLTNPQVGMKTRLICNNSSTR